jgi:hypothetical protein
MQRLFLSDTKAAEKGAKKKKEVRKRREINIPCIPTYYARYQ